MENYFVLLELPFDPPEEDVQKINEAISKKHQQWNKDMINPVRKVKASEYMAHLDDIKKVMLDPTRREQEAVKAKQIKCSKRKELDMRLALYLAKGDDELSEKNLRQLVKVFGPFGFTSDEIKHGFREGKRKRRDTIKPAEVLDKSLANNIRNSMKHLDMGNKTLYEILGMSSSASCNQLCEAADSMKRKILSKGDKTGRDNAIQALCGLCAVIFKDATSKRKYDNYVNLTRYGVVNDAVDELALGNAKKIDPKMKEGLIDLAVGQYHTSVSDASVYINNYCFYMGYVLPDNKIICGICGTENSPGSVNCIKCSKPLIIVCPACGTENNNSAKGCAKCGFDLSGMDQAVGFLQQARQKFAEKKFDEAERLIEQAKVFWPNHPDIEILEGAVTEERRKAVDIIDEIMKAVQEKKFYTARTKINQAKVSGFKIDDSVSKHVTDVLADVERRLDAMRSLSGDEAFRIARDLSDRISDSEELKLSLRKFPPNECPEFTYQQIGGRVILSWEASPSVGDVFYKVVRKENSYPNDAGDGIVLYSGKELSYTDSELKKNIVYFYSVFAVRVGIFSKATKLVDSVAVVDKVTDVKAIGGDNVITLLWNRASTVTEIRLWKYCGAVRPDDEKIYETVPCTRLDGSVINDLINGSTYWFAISAGHTLNGKLYFAEKVYVSAVPQRPIKPLQDFSVKLVDRTFQAKWKESEWDVILFYSRCEPDYTAGIVYDLNDVLSKYEKIEINLMSISEAEFALDFVGECYIIPGVINASNVILNHEVYISSVPCVKNISFDLNSSATEMYVTFTWPRGIERSVLVYRMDGYPSGVDDPLAYKIEWSKRQYETREGILISNPVQGMFYAEVYTYIENEGRRIYSDGIRVLLNNEPQREVFYTFKYKRAGLFNKVCRLTVTVEASGSFLFPAFAIVSKFKSIPLKRGDGDIVCSVEESTEIKGMQAFEFEINPLQQGVRIKMFFLNDKNYKTFRITCKSGNSI